MSQTRSSQGRRAATTSASNPPAETRTDDNVTEPSTVAPGDAPADTTDPTERVSTVPPMPSENALRAGTVNSVLVNPALPSAETVAANLQAGATPLADGHRIETYPATRPDGTQVQVMHNLDTGETSVGAHSSEPVSTSE